MPRQPVAKSAPKKPAKKAAKAEKAPGAKPAIDAAPKRATASKRAAVKTVPTKSSVADLIAKVDDPSQRRDAETLVAMMTKVTGEKAVVWGPSIIGFGQYHYVYESGREGDSLRIGFSPRKGQTVLYVKLGGTGEEAMLKRMGKVKASKGCVYVKRLADVDTEALRALIAASWKASLEKYPR